MKEFTEMSQLSQASQEQLATQTDGNETLNNFSPGGEKKTQELTMVEEVDTKDGAMESAD